jgi:hypothetical protein
MRALHPTAWVRPLLRRRATIARLVPFTAALAGAAVLACEDSRAPTAAREPERPSADLAIGAGGAGNQGVIAEGTIPLPVNQSVSTSGVAFGVTQTGTGPDGVFKISNSSNTNTALQATTSGKGRAGLFQVTNSADAQPGLDVRTSGTGEAGLFRVTNTSAVSPAVHGVTSSGGPAGRFEITNANNGSNALEAFSNNSGRAFAAVQSGSGEAGYFQIANPSSIHIPLDVEQDGLGSAGRFATRNVSNGNAALVVEHDGEGVAGAFTINNASSNAAALTASMNGNGWAGLFSSNGTGVGISTNGGIGLQVVGGTKNAVVATPSGARALYTEESTEVWFTDYGFGKLQNGRARILLDPTFAQTVDVDKPYLVFVQAYGDADMYVRDRTPLGFEVVFRGGNDRNAEFGYRVVAKRKGFEAQRLERAPWADNATGIASTGIAPKIEHH